MSRWLPSWNSQRSKGKVTNKQSEIRLADLRSQSAICEEQACGSHGRERQWGQGRKFH